MRPGDKLIWAIAAVFLAAALFIPIGNIFLSKKADKSVAGTSLSLPALPDPGKNIFYYSAINERPIFVSSRRLPPPLVKAEEVQAPAPVVPLSVVLLGVMIKNGEKAIIVKRDGDPEAVTFHEGDVINGWTLTEIKPNEALLKAGESQQTLAFPEHIKAVPQQK